MKTIFFIFSSLLLLCCQPNNKDTTPTELDTVLLVQLEEALNKEQEIRKQVIESMKDGAVDSDLESQMKVIDSTNLILAKKFLNKKGWPKRSEVGGKVSDAMFYIIQHSDHATMKAYLPQLEELSTQGEAKKKHFAMMKDRVLMGDNLPQIYGTQSKSRKDKNGYINFKYYIWPIDDNNKVDSLRKEMGFTNTIEEYANRIEAEYNIDEQLP